MKILSIGNFGHGWDGSICDEEHIARALEELGHEVMRGQRGQDNVYISPNQKPYDFVLIAQWDGYPPDFIENTKKELNEGKTEDPVPVVYWAFDYQADGQEWHERLVSQADLYLSKRLADSKYPNWQWLSQDFAPDFLDKFPDYHHTYDGTIDILFTGTYLPWAEERNKTLKLVDEHYNLVIHSVNPEEWKKQGFKNVNGPIMDEALPELVHKAKINLSIDHTIEAGYWSDRAAQIMCCGGFVLHRYQPLCEAIFRSNVAYFFGPNDCLEAIEYWLDRTEDRQNIAALGYDYAQKNLKVTERVADMLNIIRSKWPVL